MNAIVVGDESLFQMTLKAAVIYDNFDFAARAAALLERVAVRVREAIRWDVKPWRLDLLKEPSLAGAAVAEAANADLILCALNRTLTTPVELIQWLEDWNAQRQTEDAAVMVLCPEEQAAAASVSHQIEQFAWRYGLSFLNSHELRENGVSMQFVHRLWQRKQPIRPGPELLDTSAPAPRPLRHWGLNE